MLLVAIGAPLGHPARSLGCTRPLRTLRSRRARPDTHEIPLLCGRRQRQLFCSRGPPAAEGVEARGGRGGGLRHVLHGIGSVASVGPKGRHAGSPRQVAPAGAGAVLSMPTARCWLARSRCRLARCRLAPAPALKGPTPPSSSASAPLVARGRSVRQLPFPAPHSLTRGPTRGRPLTRSAPFVHVACCGFSPARGGSAGTRRHTPRGSPSAPPLHDPNPGPNPRPEPGPKADPKADPNLNPNLDPRPNPNPDPEPDPNQALPGPGELLARHCRSPPAYMQQKSATAPPCSFCCEY